MDKELIERIALEVAQEADVLDADGECPKREGADITEYVLDFAHRFLSRIDADRGKEAVVWRVETGYEQPKYLYFELPPKWTNVEPRVSTRANPNTSGAISILSFTASRSASPSSARGFHGTLFEYGSGGSGTAGFM